ncbi:MAG: DUF499 domain-containing protein [Candidatus Aenigmatarchaeota archaeon]
MWKAICSNRSYKLQDITVWGYLAHSLGRYDYIRNDDEKLTVPDISTLRKVLGNKPTIILIDEIVDYAYGLRGSKIGRKRICGFHSSIFR